jgi:mono/diheme cytochrome c family protein
MSAHAIAAIGLLPCALLLAGCHRVTEDMTFQPRHNAASTSPLFADGQATRPQPAGTFVHAHGDLASISSGRAGLDTEPVDHAAPVTAALISRGHERYTIYCLPCHGEHGAGDGEVVRRGFPAPPPIDSPALRAASDAQLHDAIRNGAGAMYPFADRVSDADAWAVVSYLRVMQHAPATKSSQ